MAYHDDDEDIETGEDGSDGGTGSEGKGEGEDAKPNLLEEEIKALRKEVESARGLAKEHEQNARYWSEKAQKAESAGQERGQQQRDEEEEDPAAFADDLSAKGSKAIAAKGFVRQADVERMVEDRVSRLIDQRMAARDEELAGVAAILGKKGMADGDRLAAVNEELVAISKQYPKMDRQAAIEWAAERAEGKLKQSGGGQEGREDRDSRINRQGPSGRSGGARDTAGLNKNDRNMLAKLGAEAGLTPEEFAKIKANKGREW